jgi:hypothetical protein
MKYRAPAGVTALFLAGEAIAPDEAGIFDAREDQAAELAAHGCIIIRDNNAPAGKSASRGRARTEKVN